jgi:phosphoglycerol transferase MdoB-like AlkP superfamily enzyme
MAIIAIPKKLRWIFSIVFILLFIMFAFRLVFYFSYHPPQKAFSGSAFLLGLRYDARISCIVGLSMLLLTALPFVNPFKKKYAISFWNVLLPIVFMVLLITYAIDFYHFDYVHQRLNATILNYIQDAGISYKMMWQTYPLLKIFVALVVLMLLAKLFFKKILAKYVRAEEKNKRAFLYYLVGFLIMAICIFGKIGQYPLRWSDAFTLNDDFKANVALNPFQSFFSTLNFRKSTYDLQKVKKGYGLLANYLEVQKQDSTTLNFNRNFTPTNATNNQPNIVLIICESFSSYKSSMVNNPLNTTPFFKELSQQGAYFNRCFSPAYGTARGIWATLTGIPDVESPGTASRNPNAVNQHLIINDFKNYENFYFLGGSATWANMRGVLTNNINNLHLYEEQDYKAKKIDVWGISDKNLFLEANTVLKNQSKPFFAVIQTADNHRPYTIPKEDEAAFKKTSFNIDTLKKYGFESNEEMNAFRYTDFCYQQFMQAATKEKYFDNTIFVFVGDHGIRYLNSLDYLPKSYVAQGLTCEYVPLLFYAPKLTVPKKNNDVCSQVDILPSIASLANMPYRNNTFGRNLFDTDTTNQKLAFIIDHDVSTIGLISNEYYFLQNKKTAQQTFVSILNNEPVPTTVKTDSVKNYLKNLSDAYYETAKYLLLNNKKQ